MLVRCAVKGLIALLAVIATSVVFVSLAGCGKMAGGARLVYWDDWSSPNYAGAPGVQALLDEFRKAHPEANLEYQCTYENGQETRKILTNMAAGTPPDVYLLDRFLLASFVARGALTDLTAFAEDAGITKDRYFKPAWDEVIYKGKVWAVPFDIGSRMLYYRPADLKEIGAPGPPKTWQQLEEYSDKLLKRDSRGKITRIGFVPGMGNDFIYMYGWLNGGEFMRGNKVTCDDPKIVEALTWMKRFRDKYGSRSVNDFGQGLTQAAFGQGKISMMITGDWEIRNIAKYSPSLDYAIAQPPAPEGRQSTTWVGGYAFVIPAKARNKKAAMEFIKFMTSPESQKLFYTKTGMFPAGKVALGLKLADQKQRPFLDALEAGRIRPVTPIARLYWDTMMRVQEEVLSAGSDPKTVLSKAARELQAEQDKYK